MNVRIGGWRSGAVEKRISLVHLLQDELGVGLAAGKRLLDDFVEQGTLVLEVPSAEAAARLVARAGELGLVCEIVDV